MSKKQKRILDELYLKYYRDKENLIPSPIEDKDFIKYITDYFWGTKRYVALSMNQKQANVIILMDIISEYKGVKE